MAAKVIFFLAAIATIAYASETDCNCDPPTESEDTALWDFLKKLSSEPEAKEASERLDAVLPGELSPLLDCNCLGKTEKRRKRKILPEVAEGSMESDYSNDEPVYELKKTPKCAEGYTWFGIMCVDSKLVLDK